MTQTSPSDHAALPAERTTKSLAAPVAVVLIVLASLGILSATFDERLALAALTLSPSTVWWGQRFSDLGLSGYMFALSALVGLGAMGARLLLRDRRLEAALTLLAERALYIFATLAASGLAAQTIKHIVGRARPKYMDAFGAYYFDMLSWKNSLASFPSGHSTTAFAMATALGLFMPRLRIPLFVLAALIAMSRVVVSDHYASDIAAGSMLGVLAALAVTAAAARWGFAFERVDSAVRVKGRGVIRAVIRQGSAA